MLQIPRWKAENVSTQEVANAISSLDFIEEANVYGVTMPGENRHLGEEKTHIVSVK